MDTTQDASFLMLEDGLLRYTRVTDSTEIVDIEDLPLQGLAIYTLGKEVGYRGMLRTYYWQDNNWVPLKE